MKKFYFIGLMGLSALAFAQTSSQTPSVGKASMAIKQPSYDVPTPSPVVARPSSAKFGKTLVANTESKIGSTLFINQTGNAPYRRVMAYADGKISVTWTTSSDNGTNGFLTRGSAYNTYNGSTWANSASSSPRIENFRTGFPSIVSNGNKEMIVAHRTDTSGQSRGLVINTNTAIGSGTWSTQTKFEPAAQTPSQLWPRSAVSGDYLLVVANFQDSTKDQPNKVIKNGVVSPLVYSRYKISTNTWVDEELTFPNYTPSLFVDGNPDIYSIDANGSNVAVVCGYYFTNLVLWKSADNGATWTTKVIDSFPIQGYRYDIDSLMPAVTLSNGSVHVLVDNNGKAHVFSGMAHVQDSILGDGFFTYSYSRVGGGVNDGILYWSEYQPDSLLRKIAYALPVNGDSTVAAGSFTDATRRYGISNSTWPSAGIDASGKIYLTYSALTPLDKTSDGSDANYRDILVTYSADNGSTWATPQNVTAQLGFNIEQVYPSCAKFVNDNLHISYLTKEFPGSSVANTNTEVFSINYLPISVAQILSGTVGITEQKADLFTIQQNYPNPFHGSTNIDVNFKRSVDAKVTITDIMGKEISVQSFTKVPTGNSSIQIYLGEIPAGVYLYTIDADGQKLTGKMMVN